ncbi:MAG: DMT family transporter [Rhodospirillaceae bacterium]
MTRKDIVIGSFWGLGAATWHSVVPNAVNLLQHIPPIELVFLRNLIGMIIFLSFVCWKGFSFLKTNRIWTHVRRNLCNFAGMWLWFIALSALPIATAVSLHFTVPLMVVVLAIAFLGERPGLGRLIPTFIGFAGVLIILRPGSMPFNTAAFLVLGSAFAYAGVAIYTRVLGATDHPNTTTFYYQLMVAIFSAISMGIGYWIATRYPISGLAAADFAWVTPNSNDIPALLLLAIAGTLAPYCLVRALVHAETTIIEPIEYLRLPISAAIAWFLFDQKTDIWTWLGAAIIAGATLYMARHETKMAAH